MAIAAPSRQASTIMRTSFALILLAHSLPAATITAEARDFALANWNQQIFTLSGGTATSSQVLTGGNPDAFRQLTVTSPITAAGQSFLSNIASTSPFFLYDPSTFGAILSIDVQYDIREISKSGFVLAAANYRPILSQNSTIFFLPVDDPTTSTWTTHARTNLTNLNWLSGGGANPDFSATGSPIQFGFRALLSLTCLGPGNCNAISAVTGIDNFVVTLTTEDPPAAIPEPSSLLLALPAALFLVLRHRTQ